MEYNIKTLNAISPAIYSELHDSYHVSDSCENPDAILVRSASMHEMVLPKSVQCIARAGAGTNNIPIDACSEAGICVFNTPGANANAVCELVIAAMLLSCRNIIGGIQWEKTQAGLGDALEKTVEKGKSKFVGPELRGKTLGVIGLGAIGVLVSNAAEALGMKVIGYDPMISVDHAWKLSRSVRRENSLDAVFAESDFLTVHVPLNDKTRGMIGSRAFSLCKKGI
ncbi:MAG: 3-phosphoglycerate dehydrogenase, partial [Clostridia bacterium]|nr:3-phosphoglycerate dehydrogenase [Clostridia bacterium]